MIGDILFSLRKKGLYVEVKEGNRGCLFVRSLEDDDISPTEIGVHSMDLAMSIVRTLIEEGEVN